MSANESNDMIADCLRIVQHFLFFVGEGAKDYLVKPIRVSECKALVSKMKKISQPS
jgi:hypothetical protein